MTDRQTLEHLGKRLLHQLPIFEDVGNARWSPGAFTLAADGDPFADLLYFSLVTITTLGYGDISPVAPFARISAGLEAATGTLYIAILIAHIVGSLASRKP